MASHDSEIRKRLKRGDDDTLADWLLFGSSFTQQPRAFIDGSGTDEVLSGRILQRVKDLISAICVWDTDERVAFARQLLTSEGHRFNSAEERADLEQHLYDEVNRVVADWKKYRLRQETARSGDLSESIVAQSCLCEGRGLSLDTSIYSSFDVDQARTHSPRYQPTSQRPHQSVQ